MAMRDHRNLRAFQLADEIALEVHRAMLMMPSSEQFGLSHQMRRASVSTASNIVEGCARGTEKDFLHFLHIAYGSAKELEYQLSLAKRLNYLRGYTRLTELEVLAEESCKVLHGLIRANQSRLNKVSL